MKDVTSTNVKWSTFLKDVMICSLGAYGGPEAHYGVFTDQMVVKKKYLNEEELVEMIALTGILPGPSSTQTIAAIGYKVGGYKLSLLTLAVWATPAILIMTLLSFLYYFLDRIKVDASILRYIGPMAVGFIAVASYRIGKKVIKGRKTLLLFMIGALVTFFFRQVYVFPAVLLFGGLVSILTSKEKSIWNHVKLNPPYHYLFTFILIAILSVVLSLIINHPVIYLFQSFYRYGYLVIGGGQVVIPYMYSDLVEINQFMSSSEFLFGFGFVQGLPGPMFSFSAYAGGLSARSGGVLIQVLGALVSALGIFLPGILLIFFVYPVWENLKKIKGIKVSIEGITAVAGGLILTSAIVLFRANGFSIANIIIFIITVLLLLTKKIPAPIIVLLMIVAGFIL
jgi:chromate transporter